MKRIPNFNTISTIIDRLIIENVKLAHFDNQLKYEPDKVPEDKREELLNNTRTQFEIIRAIKSELSDALLLIWDEGAYDSIDEKRTFK